MSAVEPNTGVHAHTDLTQHSVSQGVWQLYSMLVSASDILQLHSLTLTVAHIHTVGMSPQNLFLLTDARSHIDTSYW